MDCIVVACSCVVVVVVGARPIDGRGVLSIFWQFFGFLMVLHVN